MCSLSALIFLQYQLQSIGVLWVHIEVSFFIYMSWTHLTHNDSLLTIICQSNCPTDALFQLLQPLIFKPPCLFGRHTLSHATNATFFFSALLPLQLTCNYLRKNKNHHFLTIWTHFYYSPCCANLCCCFFWIRKPFLECQKHAFKSSKELPSYPLLLFIVRVSEEIPFRQSIHW